MTPTEEEAYLRGSRAAWLRILQECLRELGYESSSVPTARAAAETARWVVEREQLIAALREACGAFGDNEWEPTLNLADVVEKHLARHLYEKAEAAADSRTDHRQRNE